MDTINQRIDFLIKALGFTKTKFAESLLVSSQFVSSLCSGAKQPSDRTIADICREYGVSETWLRTGEGEMFVELPEGTDLGKYIAEGIGGEDDCIKNIIISYMKLDEKNKKIIRDFVKSLGCEGKA